MSNYGTGVGVGMAIGRSAQASEDRQRHAALAARCERLRRVALVVDRHVAGDSPLDVLPEAASVRVELHDALLGLQPGDLDAPPVPAEPDDIAEAVIGGAVLLICLGLVAFFILGAVLR